ncbi:transcription factor [Hirschfeldia incana]|nr:transcription factor [Hirschfeldia incana]
MRKKHNPLENPPAASSSDDEEEVDSSAGEEEEEVNDSSSSEEEDQQPKPPSYSAVTIAIPGKPTSDSDSGSETESDSESKKDNKSLPPSTKSATKRPPSEVTSKENTNSKRAKKDDESKKSFHRLWTEEDEIAVLQGMIDFKKDTGNSPYEDTNSYYDYIKKSISFEVSKNQFMDKLRGLKRKYMGKEKPSFTRPHEQKSYRLCKYIWGPDGMGLESAVKSNGNVSKKKSKKVDDSVKKELSFTSSPNGEAVEDDGGNEKKHDWFEKSFLVRGIAGFGVDESYVKQGWSLVPLETKKRVEEKFKKLQAEEIEFVLQKTEILREVTSMIAQASKKKSH